MNDSGFMTVAVAMKERGQSEDALFELGISGGLSFYVYVPGLELCRVPVEALQHFKAGADECDASGMPQRYGCKLSGPWPVKRALLRLERNTDHDIERILQAALNPPATPAPAMTAPKAQKWTPERLSELKAFRGAHTMPETAAKFGISEQRIRQLLPSPKPQKKPYNVFTHLIK